MVNILIHVPMRGHAVTAPHNNLWGRGNHIYKDSSYKKSLSFPKKGRSHKAHVAVDNGVSKVELGFVAATQPALHKDSWLLDTGYSAHIVNNKNLFENYEPTPGCSVSDLGSASHEGKGTVRITVTLGSNVETLRLDNALYVPASPYNLLSFGCMHRNGAHFVFSDNGVDCHILHPKTSKPIALCRNIGDVHAVANVKPAPKVVPASSSKSGALAFVAKHVTRTLANWHRIYGHLNYTYIKCLHDKEMVTGMKISPSGGDSEQCVTCIQAKQHVQPFPQQSETKYEEIGDLTHCDVWGPSRVKGPNGEHYFITFNDGAKHHVFLEFMKTKDEAKEKIKNYKMLIKVQCNKDCKAFHLDNGGEFISKELVAWFKAQGIRLEYTAPYSPSQNGIAEHLNRTIVEKVTPMLSLHNLPLRLWPFAVTHAVYLINCSPT
jgi:hypothetical protein